MNRKVSVIERIKQNGKWIWGDKWRLPVKFSLKEGSRQGKFYVIWYSGDRKMQTPVPPPKGEPLAYFEDAVKLAKIKQRHLEDEADGLKRPDPILPETRATIKAAVERFVSHIELTKNPLTHKLYEQNLRQFCEWTDLTYVDEIDRDHLFKFRKYLMGAGNQRLTADWKLMRINKMVKLALSLDNGKGPIKKSDLGKMRPSGDPEIYDKDQLQAFFRACKPKEHLRYSVLYEAAFRKEELMFLEREDVLISQQMLRVSSKERRNPDGTVRYKYEAKADSQRQVPISRELMDRIVEHMNSHKHGLVFCTRNGSPDTHLWDAIKSIAKRGKLDQRQFNLKKFRATRATEWLRPKWLGGFGYDMPTVKRLLGHEKDGDAIWSYVRRIENEVLVANMNKGKSEK